MEPLRVLVADRDATVRDGLTAILGTQPDLVPVGEAADGAEAVEMARRLHPNVVLLDADMPRLDGLEATRRIKQECPSTRVIVLTVYSTRLSEAFAAGASRYLLKDTPTQDLMLAIRNEPIGV